jgi:hypothetical protein
MAASYSKYIITQCANPEKQNAWSPTYRPQDRIKILRVDEEVVQGAKLFASAAWFFPTMVQTEISERSTKPHVHTYDEVLGVIGTDPDNPHDLCAKTEVVIGGEKYIIDKSVLIYIPAGVEHGPFRELEMDKPIIYIECRNSGKHF